MNRKLVKLLPKEQQAIQEFRQRVNVLLGPRLISMKLFGSKARGDDTVDSDIDIFLTVAKRTPELEDQIIDIAFALDLKYGVYISPRMVSVEIMQNPIWKLTSFLQNVAKEGISI